MAAIEQWQQLDPPFLFIPSFWARFREQGKGTWPVARRFRGESHQRWTQRGGSRSQPLFVVCLEAADPNWTDGSLSLVIVYGDHRRNYLECYTMEAIDEVDAKIDALPRGSMERKMLAALFHGQSFPTTWTRRAWFCRQAAQTRSSLVRRGVLSSRPVTRSRFGSPRPTRLKSCPRPKSGLTSCPTTSTRSSFLMVLQHPVLRSDS